MKILFHRKSFPSRFSPASPRVALAGTVAAHTLTLQLPMARPSRSTIPAMSRRKCPLRPRRPRPPQPPDRAFGPQSPFALMQQIAAQMDRDADAMMRQMQEIAAQPLAGPGQPIQIDMTTAAAGHAELQLRLDPLAQRRLQPEHRDHRSRTRRKSRR